MRKHLILLITGMILAVIVNPSFGQKKDFGKITVEVEGSAPSDYEIDQALLYRHVSLGYDSTIQIQNKETIDNLYYPQLRKGNDNVLRLLAGNLRDSTQNFYDMFFNLGDTIPDSVYWRDAEDKIYISYNGEAKTIQAKSSDITGSIRFLKQNVNKAVAGDIDLSFNMKLSAADPAPSQIRLKGTFDVPVGEFRQTSLATAQEKQEKGGKYRKNIYIAIIASVFLLAILGFR
ncbi:MAG: hypothetical protein P8184_07785 [Calditrichia bacterium]